MGDSDDEDGGGGRSRAKGRRGGGGGGGGGAMGMGDDDDEDEAMLVVPSRRRGRGGGGRGQTPETALAIALAGNRFSLRELAGWARCALVLSPTHPRAPGFLKAAGGLLHGVGESVDLPALWRDTLFLLADPEVCVWCAMRLVWARAVEGKCMIDCYPGENDSVSHTAIHQHRST